MHYSPKPMPPYKSPAAALLLSFFLGPVGLLYASLWGGLSLFFILIMMLTNQFYFLAAVFWFAGCVLAVINIDLYNRALHSLNEKNN